MRVDPPPTRCAAGSRTAANTTVAFGRRGFPEVGANVSIVSRPGRPRRGTRCRPRGDRRRWLAEGLRMVLARRASKDPSPPEPQSQSRNLGQRRHLEELRDAVLDPRRPVRHPLLIRGDSRDALQVSDGLLQRGASRQSSGVHDPRHGASRVPVRVVAPRELLGGLEPEVQAVHLVHVRRSACVCDGETRFGKDGVRREARRTRGVR